MSYMKDSRLASRDISSDARGKNVSSSSLLSSVGLTGESRNTNQPPSPANDSVTNSKLSSGSQAHRLIEERTSAAVNVPSYVSELSHAFYNIKLDNREIMVPYEYIKKEVPFAIREGHATRVIDDFLANDKALIAFVDTVKTMKDMLISAWGEREAYRNDCNVKNGEIRDLKARIVDQVNLIEQTRFKCSADSYLEDFDYFRRRCTTLEKDSSSLREKVEALVKEKSEIEGLRKLLKQQEETVVRISRSLTQVEESNQDKDSEIERLKQSLKTATEEFDRQRLSSAASSSFASKNIFPSKPTASSAMISSLDASASSSPERHLQKLLYDQQVELQRLHPFEKSNHISRDASDNAYSSSFPAGFVFIQWYKEFHLLLRGNLSNIIGACEEYSEFGSLLPILGQSISHIFTFATEFVEQFQTFKLLCLKNSFDRADLQVANRLEEISDPNQIMSQFFLSQLQNSIYEAFLAELGAFKAESFSAEIRGFQTKLLQLYAYEQQLQESAETVGSRFSPILDSSIITLVMNMFSRFAHILWVAKCSDPPCLLHPVSGAALGDARDVCEEVMSRRKKTILEEIVLLPALYFCDDSTRDINKSRLVATGLSFCLTLVECGSSISLASSSSTVRIEDSRPLQSSFVADWKGSAGSMNVSSGIATLPKLNAIVSEPQLSLPPPPLPNTAAAETSISVQSPTIASSSFNYCQHLPPRTVGLPNLVNSCYLNAALQLLFHCPPFWHFITSLEMTEFVKTSYSSPKSVSRAMQALAQIYFQCRNSIDLWDAMTHFKSILSDLQPNLFSGVEQRDTAVVLRFILQRLHSEYKEFKSQMGNSSSSSLFSVNYYRRVPEIGRETSLEMTEKARLAWKRLQEQDGNDNPVMEMLYPLRRSVRLCQSCRHEIVNFDVVNILSLPIPSHEQCNSLRNMNSKSKSKSGSNTGVIEENQVSENTYQITIVVQLLNGVPAMISLPMTVSMSISLYELKLILIEKLVQLQRISRDAGSSDIHFHFCALEKAPSAAQAEWNFLTLARSGNGTGDSQVQTTMQTTTIDKILLPAQPKQSVLVACQLEFPAPISNEWFHRDECQYVFYDVSFAAFQYKPRHNLTGVPIALSIPYRIAFEAPLQTLPSERNVEKAIRHLTARIFPSTLNYDLFASFGQNSKRESRIPTPKSYGVELHLLSQSYSKFYEFSNRKKFSKASRIVACIYRTDLNDSSLMYAIEAKAASMVFESASNSSTYSRPDEYHPVQIHSLLDTERVKGSASAAVLTASQTTASPKSPYPRSSTPTSSRYAPIQQQQQQQQQPSHQSSQSQSAPTATSPGFRFTLQEAFQAASLQKPLVNARCQQCAAVDSVIAYDYWQVGDVLLIQLQRNFTTNYSSRNSEVHNTSSSSDNLGSNPNIWEECQFPTEGLDIRSITSARASIDNTDARIWEDPPVLFDLYGVTEHDSLGTYNNSVGHFKTLCRLNTHDSTRWACFNDSSVREVSVHEIRPDRAYLLCYVRRSACSANLDNNS